MIPGTRPGAALGKDDNTARIVLVRVVPSWERILRDKLRSTFAQAELSGSGASRVFLCFGDYDLLILARNRTGIDSVLGKGWLEGIMGIREVPAHTWKCGDVDLLDSVIRSPLVSLTFVQLHPCSYQRYGMHTELELASKITSAKDGRIALAVFGTPEVAILQRWTNPNDVVNCIDDVVKHCDAIVTRRKTGFALAHRTLTFVGIAPDVNKDTLSRSTSIKGRLQLNVSVIPGCVRRVAEAARRRFDNRDPMCWSAGVFDLSLSLPFASTRDLKKRADQIIDFRWACRTSVLSTSCSLEFDATKRRQTRGAARVLQRPIVAMQAKHSEQLIQTFDEVGRRLVNACFSFNDLIMNLAMSPAVADMCFPIANLVRDALDLAFLVREREYDFAEARAELSERLMPIHAAIDQRTIAAHAAVSPIESHSRFLVGGISRLLFALESIPMSIFAQGPIGAWFGYALAGARFPDFYHEYGVIDVPPDVLLKPDEWFPVVHEAMHAFVDGLIDRQPGVDSRIWAKAPAICSQLSNRLNTQFDLRTLGEVLVDALTFNCGPCWNPRLYFTGVWDYLMRKERYAGRQFDFEHMFLQWIIRNVCVKLIASDVCTGPLDGLVRPWLSGLYRSWGLEGVTEAMCSQECESAMGEWRFGDFQPILSFVRPHLMFDSRATAYRQRYFDDAAEMQIVQAAEGILPDRSVDCIPELLVWKLKERSTGAGEESELSRLRGGLIVLLVDAFWKLYHDMNGPGRLAD